MEKIKLNLVRKTWCVLGYKQGGKSTLSKMIGESFGAKALYYDTLHEVPSSAKMHSYKPKNRSNVGELISIIQLLKVNKQYRMLIIDEANRYCKPRETLPQEIMDMNDWCRHPMYNLSVGYIARRPVSINSNIIEIADYLIIFQLGGKNDIKYLNDLRAGLGDTVLNLPKYHFVVVAPDRTWTVCKPIKPDKIFINSDTQVLVSGQY